MTRQPMRFQNLVYLAAAFVLLALISACDIKVNSAADGASVRVSMPDTRVKVIQCVDGIHGQCPFLLYSQDCSQAASSADGSQSRILCSFVEVQSFYLPAGQSRELKGDTAELMTCQGTEGVIPALEKCLHIQVK